MGQIDTSHLELETPNILLDLGRLQVNIQLIQNIASQRGVNVRPHIKTHKCLEIARQQINAGAVGITASKVDEALVFINNGISSVTVAYPLVVASKLDRLIAAAHAHDVDLRLIVDSPTGENAIGKTAEKHQKQISIFLKIDVGLHRCGLTEDDSGLVELVQKIVQEPALNFVGLLSHAGHTYGAENMDAARAIAKEECEILMRVRNNLESVGIEVSEVSVGSTPGTLASDSYDGITEIRPGNYVFMDRMPLRLKLIELNQIALSVLATVVSQNSDYFIIDAGSKTLSSDKGAHGMSGMEGFGLAYPANRFEDKDYKMIVAKLSEEHGFVLRKDFNLEIGAKLRLVPNHSCVVANLLDTYTVLKDGHITEQWEIAARGRVH